ncbi:MAG TPA: hypothetical protein VGV35_12915, partial [Bryobacteraceae bacterium]|nr:hypothetical protein [Bryobacteraceae bacterium]
VVYAAFGIVLAAMGLSEMMLAPLADAGETDRHLFLFHAITDFTLLLALAWSVRHLAERRRRLESTAADGPSHAS